MDENENQDGDQTGEQGTEQALARPSKSASKADWKAYAIAQGMSEDDADAATRDTLAAQYADPDAAPGATTPKAAAKAAYQAGEAMTAKDAPAAVRAGAEDLPPHLRAAAVHRPITE